jgi:hypothetical protein
VGMRGWEIVGRDVEPDLTTATEQDLVHTLAREEDDGKVEATMEEGATLPVLV